MLSWDPQGQYHWDSVVKAAVQYKRVKLDFQQNPRTTVAFQQNHFSIDNTPPQQAFNQRADCFMTQRAVSAPQHLGCSRFLKSFKMNLLLFINFYIFIYHLLFILLFMTQRAVSGTAAPGLLKISQEFQDESFIIYLFYYLLLSIYFIIYIYISSSKLIISSRRCESMLEWYIR